MRIIASATHAFRFFVRLAALSSFACGLVWAQATTAQINGNVKDGTGLAIPNAELKVTQVATGAIRTTTSGGDGSYVFTNLPVGPYVLEASRDGFAKYVQSGIVLQVDSNPTVDVLMKVGSVNDQVTVEANAALVETHSTGVGTVVDNQRVIEMPLNGRNVTELIFLAGMANLPSGTGGGFLNSSRNYPTVMISVAGGAANWTTYLLDGATHNDAYNSLNLPLPFPDAVQEFKVESSALPAQYGQHASATVNVITKSGSNQFHGDAFEFLRNGDLNARDFFAPTRDTLKRNQFGGTLGGPVIRNKLFFFAGYQGTIQRSEPGQNFAWVPTPAMLAGDFTTAASAACQNGKQINLSAAEGFVANTISPALFSPAALIVDSHLPVSSDPCGHVTFPLLSNPTEHTGVTREDWQKSDRHSMYVRAFVTNFEAPSTFDGKNALTLSSNGQHDRVYALAFGDTYLIGTSVVSSFRIGANRAEIPKVTDNFATWAQLGSKVPFNPDTEPRYTITGGNGFSIGGGNAIINHDIGGPNPTFTEDISWVKGSHQFGFGATYTRTLLNYASGVNATGAFTFNGTVTGMGLADFMVGKAVTWAQGNVQSYLYNRQQYSGVYAQDSWKLTRRLTLNYGLRWEPFYAFLNKHAYLDHFDPGLFAQNIHSTLYPNAPAGLIFPGDPQWSAGDHSIASNRYAIFLPRVGVVWDPTGQGKMSIRASFGAFTDRGALYSMSAMAQDSPYGTVISIPNVSLADPWANYPGGNPLPLTLNRNLQFPAFASYVTDNLHWKPTWVNQYNLTIQRQVGADWLLQTSYIGNTTSHLITAGQINPALFLGTGPCNISGVNYSTCSTTSNTNQRRLLYLQNAAQGQYYGIVSAADDGGTQSYNGLYLSVQKRLSKATSVLANYTWSHCIGDFWNGNPGNTGISSVTPFNRKNDRGNCILTDQRHVFNLSAVVTSPKFSGKLLRLIASDWQIAPIMKLKSAGFVSAVTNVDSALNGEAGADQRANRVSGVSPYVSAGAGCSNAPCVPWFNPAAFVAPPPGTLGNTSLYSFKGPGVFQLDLALSRSFVIREKTTLQFRAEAFNLPNHLNPAVPVTSNTQASFATSSPATFNLTQDISGTSGLSTGDYRVIQFAIKYVF